MRSYLVVGNQTLDSPELAEAIRERVANEPTAAFYVVVPSTQPSGGRLTWDEDEARANAQERLSATLNRLHQTGVVASGEVGCDDPIQATRDALRHRQVDEVIVSTLPPGISRWLGQDIPSKLKGSIDVPVTVVTSQKQPAAMS